jgi:hypothetical protein
MTKRETEQKRRDMEAGQRAFDRLHPHEEAAIVDALHAEQVEVIVDRAHAEWLLLLGGFEREGAECAKTISFWPSRLDRAPHFVYNELEWADSLFVAAARANVNYEVGLALRNMGPAKAAQWLVDRLQFAAGPGTSSNTSHNMMRACQAEAYARALEVIQWNARSASARVTDR